MSGFDIRPAATEADLAAVASLFASYAASLPIDLAYQGFGAEQAGLPGKYAAPAGVLLIARSPDGDPLGCIGLRPLPPAGVCEMKRLFVLPAARGLGLGVALIVAVIAAATDIGYREMRLDTLATMTAAIVLYERHGFTRIPAYYAPIPPDTIFMGLKW